MNIIPVNIGNTNITIGLFLDDQKKQIVSIPGRDDNAPERLSDLLTELWEQVPVLKSSKEHKRDGIIVISSVNDKWTQMVSDICKGVLGEKVKIIGKDVALPIETALEDNMSVGTDRLVNAAAAFAVIEDACLVADFGSAVTIDLVDEQGIFHGGIIAPGFEMGAQGLHNYTDKLPLIKVEACKDPVGTDTVSAMNAGLVYSAAGLLRMITEKYAEQIGKWPHTIVTGGAADLIKNQCDFVDSWVEDLTVSGIVIAYKKHLADQAEAVEFDELNKQVFNKDNPNMN